MFQKGIGNGWIVKKAEKIIGVLQQDFGSVYTDMLIKKLCHVMDDMSHQLHNHLFMLITRFGCMNLPSAVTSRYLCSFVHQAIQHHNANYKRGDVQIEM